MYSTAVRIAHAMLAVGVCTTGMHVVKVLHAGHDCTDVAEAVDAEANCVSGSQIGEYADPQRDVRVAGDACIYNAVREVMNAQDVRFDAVTWFSRSDEIDDALLDRMMPLHVMFKRATSDCDVQKFGQAALRGGMMQFTNHQLADIIDDAEYRSKQRKYLQGLRIAGLVGMNKVFSRMMMPQPPQDGNDNITDKFPLAETCSESEFARDLVVRDVVGCSWDGEPSKAKDVYVWVINATTNENSGKIISRDMLTFDYRFCVIPTILATTAAVAMPGELPETHPSAESKPTSLIDYTTNPGDAQTRCKPAEEMSTGPPTSSTSSSGFDASQVFDTTTEKHVLHEACGDVVSAVAKQRLLPTITIPDVGLLECVMINEKALARTEYINNTCYLLDDIFDEYAKQFCGCFHSVYDPILKKDVSSMIFVRKNITYFVSPLSNRFELLSAYLTRNSVFNKGIRYIIYELWQSLR